MPSPSTRRKSKPRSRTPKRCFYFGSQGTDGRVDQKSLLGGKGANLAEMTSIGLPVPPGFTITTDTCAEFNSKKKLPAGLMDEVRRNVAKLEKELHKEFGSDQNPLLVSVRSGAAVSMPGMMDTVLNLGLTDKAVLGLAEATNNERFAWDAYRRLINMFGNVVMGVDHEHFEDAFDLIKKKYKTELDTDVPADGLRALCDAYKKVYKKHVGANFPQDPIKQLQLAVEAVFKSWNKGTAISYRRINDIKGLIGTAVNVQSMVYGNMGEDSGTGVAFTRNPSTGKNEFYGEFLINVQGEDVVAGIRTPEPINGMRKWNAKVFKQLEGVRKKLEKHYREMQDIEFTIERGRLFMLQTRSGKRTGAAAVRIACEMVKEKLIDRKTALMRVPAADLTQLLLPSFDSADKKKATTICTGLPASPGAATGALAFTAEEAVERASKGEDVLLVRKETSPEDVDGMHSAAGILTSTGGMTSHAAVVARGWGKCCVVGAGALHIDAKKGVALVDGKRLTRKDVLSIDGASGEVMLGEIKRKVPKKISGDFAQILKWSDSFARMKVRTNADAPADAQRARDFGAVGIGLCRTEHMFFQEDRIGAMREMILAKEVGDREKALKKLLPFQRRDFQGILTAMKGCPVTIRLLDPPLHEFLPHEPKAQREMAKQLGIPTAEVTRRVHQLHEMNPMLGHRGCRLAITYPEILRMQVRAIVEAMIACKRKKIDARPEIMIPLIGTYQELAILRELTEQTINEVRKAKKFSGRLNIPIGTMIEIPRAAITADEVADVADFFSFGTNDLTQMAFGYSRDDAGVFLPEYVQQEILEEDPFNSIDRDGVGQLVDIAVRKGRTSRPGLKLGICGEHGGDPSSIEFFETVGGCGLDYVSCSPFRVPIARLVAAQAAIARDE